MDRAQFVTILMNKQEQLPSKASKCDGSKATAVCKHCGLTLQGMEREGEDICVDCLADLCFPPSAIIKIGCIKQTEADNEQEETDE